MNQSEEKRTSVIALILAAGRSRRFGADKRRHVLQNGRSMLATTLSLYQTAFQQVRLVLSPRDSTLVSELGIRLRVVDDVVVAEDADSGMGHSLAAGIQGISADLTFVGLADMPFVQPATLALLRDRAIGLTASAHQGESTGPELNPNPSNPSPSNPAWLRAPLRTHPVKSVIVPRYNGRRGHPVGFGRVWYQSMRQLTGDSGARAIVESALKAGNGIEFVDVEDAGVLQDLDQPTS